MSQSASEFQQALLSLDRIRAKNLLMQSMEVLSAFEIAEKVIVPALEKIGEDWEHGKIALSQVFMSSRICEELVNIILPSGKPDTKDQPDMAIAVLDDHHLLGKKIVYSMLRAGGFGLHDYGQMNVDALVNRVKEDNIKVLLISALMLPSALRVKDVRVKLNQIDPGIKIVVGGAPFRFDNELWREVGADAMGREAGEAARIISRIAGGIL